MAIKCKCKKQTNKQNEADKTDQIFGVNEMLLATSINGIIFALFSGQPLMIFGATGPFLVLEEMLYYVRTLLLFAFCFCFLHNNVIDFNLDLFKNKTNKIYLNKKRKALRQIVHWVFGNTSLGKLLFCFFFLHHR